MWPGSHLAHQQLFAERGPTVLLATSGHTLSLDKPSPSGDPRPVTARRGDLLLAHFLLGHNIGGNTSPATRRILDNHSVSREKGLSAIARQVSSMGVVKRRG